jgi:hypothetical protein
MTAWLHSYGFDLNSREWAALLWLGVFGVFVLCYPAVRSSLRACVRAAVKPKLAAIWLVYLTWVVVFVALARWVGIWKTALMKDTIVWTVTAGLASIASFTEAWKPQYFRQAVRKAAGVVVLLEYLTSLASFRLWAELLLQPIVFLFAVAPIVAKEPGERAAWQRASTWVFLVLLAGMLTHTALALGASRETLDWTLFALRAILPVALALWVLLAVFGLAVVASYEQALCRLDLSRGGNTSTWKPKAGLVLALRLGLKWIHEAAKGGTFRVAHAASVRSAFRAATAFKDERISEKKRELAYQADLARYAGSAELDERGRPRDRREFRETVRALEWLHTCQTGWYRRKPVGYKSDLIGRFGDDFTSQGLPTPSGIAMVVSEDRQRWYAWRRTPAGRCFAVGASHAPPDQWLYDGPAPPRDFPGLGEEWGDAPFSLDRAPNWYD